MYPCAGLDIVEPVVAYGDRFDTFLFVDMGYRFEDLHLPCIEGWQEIEGSQRLEGPRLSRPKVIEEGRTRYRQIEPAWLRHRYRNVSTGRTIEVVLRRGFGQCALHEIADGGLHMFLHRGDSDREGLSGTYIHGNRRTRHPPLSKLFDVIRRKLALPALVASDGSNTSIPQLVDAARNSNATGEFQRFGLMWRMAGILPGRLSARTVVWKVEPVQMELS